MSNFIINPYVFAVDAFDNGRSLSKSISTGESNCVRLVSADNETTFFNNIFGSNTAAFSISMWIKAGWTNNLNTNIHFFAVNDGSTTGRNQQVRIFYTESNNRLEFRMGQDTNNRSVNFWALHSNLSQTGLAGSAASQYWSSTQRGSVNSNDFTHLVITKGTGGTLSASNIAAYWNGNKLGNPFYSSGNNFGTINMTDTSSARRICIGSNAHSFSKSGDDSATIYDEISIFNIQLSDSQVTSLYNGGVPQDASSVPDDAEEIRAHYRFEGGAGSNEEVVSSVDSANAPQVDINGDSSTTNDPA